MQQKNHIDMILFGEIISLEFENQVEDNLSTTTHVSKEVEETKRDIEIEIEVEEKKEAHKEKTKTDEKTDKEAQHEKVLIEEKKEHNQCGSTDAFTLTNMKKNSTSLKHGLQHHVLIKCT